MLKEKSSHFNSCSEHPDVARLRTTSLLRFIDQYRYSFLMRSAMKIDKEFLSANFSGKIKFLSYLLKWFFIKLRKKIKTAIYRKSILLNSRNQRVKSTKSTELIIAVHASGGIGDLVNASAFLTAFSEKWPLIKFDIFFHNLRCAEFMFAKADFVNEIFHDDLFNRNSVNYDLAFTLTDWLKVDVNHSHSSHSVISEIAHLFENARSRFNHYDLYVQKHPFLDGHYANTMVENGFNRISAPGYFLNLNINETHLRIYPNLPTSDYLDSLSLSSGQYITVHDGFDNDFLNKTRVSTKQWNMTHWSRACQLLQQQFPELKIVQIGAATSRLIPGVTLSLINKTSLEEAAVILQGAKFHIDGESGLVRIATALKTPCITLFGPTNYDYFSIQSNFNLRPTVCGGCYWLSQDWMAKCPRGLQRPECLESILPEHVIDAAKCVNDR